jgi:hypothetical protein
MPTYRQSQQAKGTIGELTTELSNFRGRLAALEKKYEAESAERETARSLILQWETGDRVGQGTISCISMKKLETLTRSFQHSMIM